MSQELSELPEFEQGPPVPPPVEPAATAAYAVPTWYRRVSSVLFIIFCFEMGLFLLVYPWIDQWSENYFSMLVPRQYLADWRVFWNSSYFRGAVSGVGLVNIWVALNEVLQMIGFRRQQ
jgi:hypothetical protein